MESYLAELEWKRQRRQPPMELGPGHLCKHLLSILSTQPWLPARRSRVHPLSDPDLAEPI